MLKKLLIVVFLVFVSSWAVAEELNLKSFKAKYKFDFSGLNAAKGELTAKLDNNTYTINFSGKTVSPVKWFFKLKVKIKDAIDLSNNRDIYYYSSIERPKKVKKIYVKFDNRTQATVLYQKNSDKKEYIVKSKNGVFSPLTVYMFFITHKIELGKAYYRDVVVSKKLYRIKILPIKEETINLDSFGREKGKRRVLKAELSFYKLDRNGELIKNEKVKKLVVWVSLKPPQLPVLVQMWHFIGVFEAKLIDLKVY
ncbi:DUF3108 domain-containing protein [Hippea alviniae]|uniref:DUF3108 domain-containing protein n=1 Tax=Hippea alviniae TaxID=1279027 RepID=UPI0003B7B98B|nr:DUF3108 domain-containing protein [Hippea alviniae]